MKRDEAWFVSDVHLRDGDRDHLEPFLELLDLAATRTRALYIVGDLFEFWIGDRQGATAFYAPLFARIRSLTRAGVAVRVIHGNRDFLMGEVFTAAGAELLPEEVVLELGGASVHVSHGDQLCLDDRTYLAARRLFRSAPVRWVSRHLPAALGRWLARAYRGISERKKERKARVTGNRFHTIERGVRRRLESGDHDVLLCGHIHWLNDGRMDVGGRPRRVITTGAWEDGPNYVVFDGADFALRRFVPATAALEA